MALEDRDRTFEKALARHLRSSSLPGAGATSSAQSPASSCPDAETLAAYHDGTLPSDECALWKQHVLSCDDCQLILSHLATPLDVPVALESREPVLAAAATRTTAQAQQVSPDRSASPAPIVFAAPRRKHFRWLVPAGAIAAGVLAFVVFRESRALRPLPADRVEVADNRQPIAVTPPAAASSSAPAEARERTANEEASSAVPRKAKDLSLAAPAGATAGSPTSRGDTLLKEQQKPTGQMEKNQAEAAKQYAYAAPASGPRINQQQLQSPRSLRDLAAQQRDAKKAQDKADAELAQEGKDLAAKVAPPLPAPAAPPPSGQPSFMADKSVTSREVATPPAAAPAPPAKTRALARAAGGAETGNAAAVGTLSQTVEVDSTASSALMIQAGLAPGPSSFGSPASEFLWRVGRAGSLERSSDKGTTWIPQSSGVAADLTTGFALSARVCWVVGASGTILRTTDAGAHWIKIGSPVDATIVGVRASDAFHATILVVDDPKTGATKSFKTGDGGMNWSPVSNN